MKPFPYFKKYLALLLSLVIAMSMLVTLPLTASAAGTVTPDISSAGQRLYIRLKLTDPFGFMAITSLSLNGSTLPCVDYAANGITEVGFLFLDAEQAPANTNALLASPDTVMVRGKQYDGNNFYANYDEMHAATLDHTIYFAAYATVNGQMTLSDVRSLVPSVLVEQGAQGTIHGLSITDATERALYAAILEYFEAFRQYEEHKSMENFSLKVASYNINFGQDNSVSGKPLNLQNIADVILENDLDVIALQEVHVYAGSKVSAGRHTPYEVAKLATAGSQNGDTYYWAFAAGLEGYSSFGSMYSSRLPGPTGWYTEGQGPGWDTVRQSGYGNAIISKYPILSVREVKVMAPGQTEQLEEINGYTYERRTILIAELDVNGTTVTVISTHFDLYTSSLNAAAEAVIAEMNNISTPTILLGDLNCGVNSAHLKKLKNAGFTFVGNGTPTHKDPANGQIDHIAYINTTIRDVTYCVLTDNKVSDHYPIIATLTGWKRTVH